MSWQAFAKSKGEVEGLGGRTRGERAHFLIFDFLWFPQGGGRNFPRGNNFMKWWLGKRGL
jgi:hypothetical protein